MVTITNVHIEKIEGQPARLARMPRIRVAQVVMDYMAHGWSPEEMCRQHPHLTPAEAHAAMAYYYDHQPEIDAEINAETADLRARQGAVSGSPFVLRARESGLL